jgi:dTDP-glucose 4,6-dehydratase
LARLLVTGGAGFIGSNFVHYWLANRPGERIVVLDALTYAGNESNLDAVRHRPELRFVHGNILDGALVETLLREERIDTIVHLAAESHVDRSIAGLDRFIETNVLGTHSLLKAAHRVWLLERRVPGHRFHHVSTDEVYGSLGPADPAFTEATPYAPNSPYAASKAASDHLVRAYHHTYGLQTTTTHCTNNYGEFQFPEKLIPLVIVNLLEGRPLPLYGDGQNIRDWLHVEDHCRALVAVLERGRAGETYDIGGRSEVTNLDLVRRLCKVADEAFGLDEALRGRFPGSPMAAGVPAESLIRFVADRPGHDRRYAIDDSKLSSAIGVAPRVRLEEGLSRTFRWFVDNEPWWRKLMDVGR